ncbi:MAG TPA: phosphoglucosamine mutase [Coriobacteriia bacterium]|nr:phosphoglucosamine mutase [Coriobacteriia bacterium]
MGARLFGTDGVRGVANTELTPELAFRLGEAAGHFLAERGKRGRIVVGRDTRRSGNMLESAIVAGITSSGADALIAGVVPTPAVSFLVRDLGADGGVVISASHNAPEYNGIKLFSREGFKLPDDLEDEIEDYCNSNTRTGRPIGAGIGGCSQIGDAVERYIAHAVNTIGCDLSGLRIAVDCGHGAASVTTPEAMRRLGADVVAVNCDWDGMDINVGCGSTHLGPLMELVRSGGFDFGIAHDGDADRMLAVDENGAEVDGDQIMAMCAVRLAAEGRLPHKIVVSTVMANLGFEVAMTERGITVLKTRVGDRYVLEQMQAMGATLGGEQSGHIIFLEHNTTGDGLVTALQVACTVKRERKPLSELVRVMTRYPQVLVNVPVADKAALAVSAAIGEAIRSAEERLGDSGRVLVRASGTEPLVRVMAEAANEDLAQDVVDRLVTVVKSELG